MERNLKNGDHVIFLDSYRKPHHALITAAWSDTCANLIYVLEDQKMKDQYGQQTKHESSVTHGDNQNPKRIGNCFLYPDEV